METYGSMSHDMIKFITRITHDAAQTRNMTPQQHQHMIDHTVALCSFALWKGNAAMARRLVEVGPRKDKEPQLVTHIQQQHQHQHH